MLQYTVNMDTASGLIAGPCGCFNCSMNGETNVDRNRPGATGLYNGGERSNGLSNMVYFVQSFIQRLP